MNDIQIELLPRQGGKTARMIAWMRAAPSGEHRVCVCATTMEAMRLLRENPDLESWQFVGPDDARQTGVFSGVLLGRGGTLVLGIDNADLLLRNLFRWPIGLATWTGPAVRIMTRITQEALLDLAAAVKDLPVRERLEDGLSRGTLSVNNARAIRTIARLLPSILAALPVTPDPLREVCIQRRRTLR